MKIHKDIGAALRKLRTPVEVVVKTDHVFARFPCGSLVGIGNNHSKMLGQHTVRNTLKRLAKLDEAHSK